LVLTGAVPVRAAAGRHNQFSRGHYTRFWTGSAWAPLSAKVIVLDRFIPIASIIVRRRVFPDGVWSVEDVFRKGRCRFAWRRCPIDVVIHGRLLEIFRRSPCLQGLFETIGQPEERFFAKGPPEEVQAGGK